jgi:hypothetical protein
MQKESHFEIGRAEVIEELTSGVVGQFGARFGFHYDLFVHDHVYALDAKLFLFVNDSSPDLAGHMMSARQQLTLQRHDVKMLQKSKAEVVVNLEKRPDHRPSEGFFNQVTARHAPRMAPRTKQQIIKLRHAGTNRHRDRSARSVQSAKSV